MAILAAALHRHGRLHEGVLVATVMSNLGLHIAMREAGITLRTTAVGDRYVLEELRRGGFSLGGEQSGTSSSRPRAPQATASSPVCC